VTDTATTPNSPQSDARWTWEQARLHFERVDLDFHRIVSTLADPGDAAGQSAFESLARAIMGQQLSTKAAATIWRRFLELHDGVLHAEQVLQTPAEVHRSVGVSGQKHTYLVDLSRHYMDNPDMFDQADLMSDESIVKDWTRVKGLGPWTVQMHLMFQLRRPDVFAVDDLGVRRAMEQGLGIPKDSKKAVYTKRALKWSPFRTAACRFLWDSLNA
jgi:DNA-3-methyladenine glycosylase II